MKLCPGNIFFFHEGRAAVAPLGLRHLVGLVENSADPDEFGFGYPFHSTTRKKDTPGW